MKGVTSITIINYSEASQETCLALRKELDFANIDKEKEFADNDYIRSFASVSGDEKTISDFVIAVEEKDSKMIIYMAGKIKV